MSAALRNSGLSPSDVTYVNAHATSTPLGERGGRTRQLKRLFGSVLRMWPCLLSRVPPGIFWVQRGALEAAFTAMACYHGILPPHLNLDRNRDRV
ncbi:hypothetical protein CRUP_022508 [Coryphaenoides rupestris]|nr:hypothetical protein CRUP_022508 [Coryphaenoides rupestris]